MKKFLMLVLVVLVISITKSSAQQVKEEYFSDYAYDDGVKFDVVNVVDVFKNKGKIQKVHQEIEGEQYTLKGLNSPNSELFLV